MINDACNLLGKYRLYWGLGRGLSLHWVKGWVVVEARCGKPTGSIVPQYL